MYTVKCLDDFSFAILSTKSGKQMHVGCNIDMQDYNGEGR